MEWSGSNHQKTIRKSFVLLFCCLSLFFTSCHRAHEKIEPRIDYTVQDYYLKQLPSPFPPLSKEEIFEPWASEYQIGLGFAHELDLYQAMTAFKRASFLAPKDPQDRRIELQYDILLCYYFGKKYEDVIYTFEKSELKFVNGSFPALHDILLILYDSYQLQGYKDKADQILQSLNEYFPETKKKIELSSALRSANFPYLQEEKDKGVQDLLSQYEIEKKSVKKAQTLNAIIPGAGYLYLGQKQSAITAFLLNGLFIAAAVHFFDHGDTAAGIITTGFETGWYFGGINGAKEEATYYNERVFEKHATPLMNKERLFPILMLQYAF